MSDSNVLPMPPFSCTSLSLLGDGEGDRRPEPRLEETGGAGRWWWGFLLPYLRQPMILTAGIRSHLRPNTSPLSSLLRSNGKWGGPCRGAQAPPKSASLRQKGRAAVPAGEAGRVIPVLKLDLNLPTPFWLPPRPGRVARSAGRGAFFLELKSLAVGITRKHPNPADLAQGRCKLRVLHASSSSFAFIRVVSRFQNLIRVYSCPFVVPDLLSALICVHLRFQSPEATHA